MAGELRSEHIGLRVVLNGWVDGVRDMGGLIFFEVRDRSGKVQCVVPTQHQFRDANDASDSTNESRRQMHEISRRLRNEYVLSVTGVVSARSNINPKIVTGEVEIIADSIQILNSSDVPRSK